MYVGSIFVCLRCVDLFYKGFDVFLFVCLWRFKFSQTHLQNLVSFLRCFFFFGVCGGCTLGYCFVCLFVLRSCYCRFFLKGFVDFLVAVCLFFFVDFKRFLFCFYHLFCLFL